MSEMEDLTDRKVGAWRVLSFAGMKPGRKYFWNCLCTLCNRQFEVNASYLRSAKRPSLSCVECSHKRKGRPKSAVESAQTKIFCSYRNNAKKRGIEWKLLKDEFIKLLEAPCVYCGRYKVNQHRNQWTDSEYSYNGVDRVDSSINYNIDNVVACCGTCNRAKSDLSLNAFLDWIKIVSEYQPYTRTLYRRSQEKRT